MPRPRLPLWIPAPLTLAMTLACAQGDGMSSTLSGGTAAITSATASSTSVGSTGDTTDAGESDASTDPGSASDSTSTTTTGPGSTSNPDGLPNGSECTDDAMCISGNCYTIPLPINDLPSGICGVCDEDKDCVDAGLGISCTISAMDYQAVCTDGSAGSFCESQAACKDGLWCQILVEGAEGLLPMSCGTCRTDADCDGGRRCTPSLDLVTYTGHKYCALPQSLKNDELCPLVDGDPLCLSGHCEIADLGGLLDVAVCGQCSADSDCPMGQTCKPGAWADGPVGSLCG